MVDMTRILHASTARAQREKIELITNLYLNSLIAQGLLEDLRVSDIMRDIASAKGYDMRVNGKGPKFVKRR